MEWLTSIRKATTNTTYSGFFAFNAPHEPTLGWVLGFRGSASRDFHHGIAFLNDTAAPRTDITLSFEAVQWNYRNEIPMTNTVEYLVSDTLVGTAAQGSWTPIPAFTVTPPYTASYNDGGAECWRNGPRCVTLDGVTLEVGRYLIVRFTDLRTPTSGGIGIADFRFTSVRKPLTNCIIFR